MNVNCEPTKISSVCKFFPRRGIYHQRMLFERLSRLSSSDPHDSDPPKVPT